MCMWIYYNSSMNTQQQYFNNITQSGSANTTILILGFIGIMIGLGFLIAQLTGNSSYVVYSIVISVVMNFVAYYFAESIALAQTHARFVSPQEEPRLYTITAKLAQVSSLPMPKIHIIEDTAMNAFATGRNKNHASIAVTRGLYERLDDAELSGVVAHELGHIKNNDILVSTMAVVLAGCISLLANVLLVNSSSSRESSRNVVTVIVSLAISFIAPFFGILIQMAVSRSREYLADKTGAYMTGEPLALASALNKIAYHYEPLKTADQSTAHLFISNPFGGINMSGLFSSHPRTEDRITQLSKLSKIIHK